MVMRPARPLDASRKIENIFLENQYFSRESGYAWFVGQGHVMKEQEVGEIG